MLAFPGGGYARDLYLHSYLPLMDMRAVLPERLIVKPGALDSLPEVLENYDCRRLSIVTDRNIWTMLGSRLESLLKSGGTDFGVVLVSGADDFNVESARRSVEEGQACLVLGVGGGRPIDVAKYAAFLSNRRFVSVPTAISHDGFASPIVALKDASLNPLSIFTRPPAAVVVDTDIVSRAPRRLLASGVGDIVGKVTSVADARLAIRLAGEEVPEISLVMAESAAKIVLSGIDEVARWSTRGIELLVQAGLLAGMAMAIAGSSRPCSGSEHLFSHALDKFFPEKGSLHGEQVGVGAIVMAYLHGLNWREVREALERVGAPVTARELGVPVERIIEALLRARELRRRFTILDVVKLDEERVLKVLRETRVIG